MNLILITPPARPHARSRNSTSVRTQHACSHPNMPEYAPACPVSHAQTFPHLLNRRRPFSGRGWKGGSAWTSLDTGGAPLLGPPAPPRKAMGAVPPIKYFLREQDPLINSFWGQVRELQGLHMRETPEKQQAHALFEDPHLPKSYLMIAQPAHTHHTHTGSKMIAAVQRSAGFLKRQRTVPFTLNEC